MAARRDIRLMSNRRRHSNVRNRIPEVGGDGFLQGVEGEPIQDVNGDPIEEAA